MESWLSYVGAFSIFAVASRAVFYVLKLLYLHYIAYYIGLTSDLKSFGGWCVITGSTDGIGKAYAFALAKKGIDLILISRNPSKLESTAKEIREKHDVQIKVIAVDFTHDVSIYDKIKTEIGSTPIGILINNVGLAQWPGILTDVPDRDRVIQDILNVNGVSCMRMNSLIIPQMMERRKGLILNVASLSCITPLCGYGIYGSVKSCVNYFSKALTMEYKDKGITVQSVIPGYVATKMSKQRPSLISPTPEQFVASQLRTIGLSDTSYGYIVHTLMASVASFAEHCMPESMRQFLSINLTKVILKHFKKKCETTKKD